MYLKYISIIAFLKSILRRLFSKEENIFIANYDKYELYHLMTQSMFDAKVLVHKVISQA